VVYVNLLGDGVNVGVGVGVGVGVAGGILVSKINTDEEATLYPSNESNLTFNINVSLPSVVKSLDILLVTEPVPLLIINEPLFVLSTKSEDVDVPELVQYNVVPLGTLVVVTVNVTEEPSLSDEVDGDAEYVGESEVSPIVTVELVATIGPDVEPVLNWSWKLSEPSVVTSFASVLEIDPLPEVIVNDPDSVPSLKSAVPILPLA
jgi:hypothetical protein